jgi:hypothetical protein
LNTKRRAEIRRASIEKLGEFPDEAFDALEYVVQHGGSLITLQQSYVHEEYLTAITQDKLIPVKFSTFEPKYVKVPSEFVRSGGHAEYLHDSEAFVSTEDKSGHNEIVNEHC